MTERGTPVRSINPIAVPYNTTNSSTAGGTAVPTTPNTNPTPSSGGLTYDEVENYWIQAGGNPQAASMAAAVADASSGLNPNASRTNPDGTTSVGLWLIPANGTPPGSTDPVANARAAVQLSNHGTDWSQWCVTWSDNNCGLDGGTYLGEGANALGSLASGQGNFNVIGSSSSAVSGTTGTSSPAPTSSKTKSLATIAVLLGAVVFVFFMVRRKTGSGSGSEGSSWSSDETAALEGGGSDDALAKQLGRSRHAIHVKRSRMKSDSDYTH